MNIISSVSPFLGFIFCTPKYDKIQKDSPLQNRFISFKTFNTPMIALAKNNNARMKKTPMNIAVISQDMGRVLLNLINNAFWAVKTVEKPLVVVKTEQSDKQIIIKVSDNGIGMTDDVKAKIFQPFFTTKPTGQGTGLGLSLAYDIVTKGHGGTIEVESKEGEGSEFIIKLIHK